MNANGIDWTGRARREAAAIIAGVGFGSRTNSAAGAGYYRYEDLVIVCAIAWLQGVNLGAHETLRAAEDSFEELRAAL